jgi:hypothetical protein
MSVSLAMRVSWESGLGLGDDERDLQWIRVLSEVTIRYAFSPHLPIVR